MEKINVNKLFSNKGFQLFITIMAIFIAIIVNVLTVTMYAFMVIVYWIIQIADIIKITGGKICGQFKKIKKNKKT